MTRRPPPSSLRLHKGPIPGRGQAKHTLPSVPRPVHVPTDVSRTINRASPEPPFVAVALYDTVYEQTFVNSAEDLNASMACRLPRRRSVERGLDTSGLDLPSMPSSLDRRYGTLATISNGIGATVASSVSLSPLTTPSPRRSPSTQLPLRGPWDHSPVISLPIDVGSVLALPKPVAISP